MRRTNAHASGGNEESGKKGREEEACSKMREMGTLEARRREGWRGGGDRVADV